MIYRFETPEQKIEMVLKQVQTQTVIEPRPVTAFEATITGQGITAIAPSERAAYFLALKAVGVYELETETPDRTLSEVKF